LALGCKDPVERIGAAKTLDPHRRKIANVFSVWWTKYGSGEVISTDVDLTIIRSLDLPKSVSRQKIASAIAGLAGARINGFHLVRRKTGKWSLDRYRLVETNPRHDEVSEEDTTGGENTTGSEGSDTNGNGEWKYDGGA
jgi:hypothetical protein